MPKEADPETPETTRAGHEPKTYDEEYVKQLRDEAATHRMKAKRADDAEDRLRNASIAQMTYGILADPTDLDWTEELADEDGWPNPDKIKDAAINLVLNKPHLGRPRGFVGQGSHSDQSEGVSLTGILKAGI